MGDHEDTFAAFWAWFSDHQGEIRDIVVGKRPGRVTEMIDRALAAHRLDQLTYEITGSSEHAELTFTPQGDPTTARFIDRMIAQAPKPEGWKIFGRVQRKVLSSALAFVKVLHDIDIADAQLKFIVTDDRYHLCFLHDGLFQLPEEKQILVVSTFLDHALGEQIVMDFIGQIEFQKSTKGVAMSLLINQIIRETGADSEAA